MKRFCVLVGVAALALTALGDAVATQPCGKAVIDDWYDNGTIDRAWSCDCLRAAIELLSDDAAPYSSARDDFQSELELRGCEGSSQQTLTATLGSPGSDVSTGVSDRPSAWNITIGLLALALAAASIWILVQRQRRRS